MTITTADLETLAAGTRIDLPSHSRQNLARHALTLTAENADLARRLDESINAATELRTENVALDMGKRDLARRLAVVEGSHGALYAAAKALGDAGPGETTGPQWTALWRALRAIVPVLNDKAFPSRSVAKRVAIQRGKVQIQILGAALSKQNSREIIMAKKKTTSSGTGLYRQGDVLIQRIDASAVPAKMSPIARENKRVILAHGEVTGHAHAIRSRNVCFLRAEGQTDRFLQVSVTSKLEHEEHDTIALPPGDYRVRIQREWAGEVSRRVED